jgi:hypothetical protein
MRGDGERDLGERGAGRRKIKRIDFKQEKWFGTMKQELEAVVGIWDDRSIDNANKSSEGF